MLEAFTESPLISSFWAVVLASGTTIHNNDIDQQSDSKTKEHHQENDTDDQRIDLKILPDAAADTSQVPDYQDRGKVFWALKCLLNVSDLFQPVLPANFSRITHDANDLLPHPEW